jgi:hypothetical protein
MKPFEKWKTEEVKRTFGVRETPNLPALQEWLGAGRQATEAEKTQVLALLEPLTRYVDYWSEEDLKVFFIIPLLQIVNFAEYGKYRPFLEATFGADIEDANQEDLYVRGRVEFVVATGEQDPQTPFFFINEYKPQLKTQNDPKGQLLIAMLASQAKNKPFDIPIYGLYTIGRNWYFVVLVGKEFSVSKQYDATDEHMIWDIFSAIKQVKTYINENYEKIIAKQ